MEITCNKVKPLILKLLTFFGKKLMFSNLEAFIIIVMIFKFLTPFSSSLSLLSSVVFSSIFLLLIDYFEATYAPGQGTARKSCCEKVQMESHFNPCM